MTVKYQINNGHLPKRGLDRHNCICAVHEDLFARARAELRRKNNQTAEMLDQLLDDFYVKSDWEDLKEEWNPFNDKSDSVIYVFGHSNGEMIALRDNGDDSINAVLPTSQFARISASVTGQIPPQLLF